MKANIRLNKKRIIFWGILFLITTIMSISGISLFNSGHGKIGSKRYALIPIAKKFNELDAVIKHADLIATVKSDKLIVTETEKDYTYTFTLEETNKYKYITCSYSGKEKKTGDFVAFELVDAIYRLNQGEDDLSKVYNLESFSESTIEQGVSYKTDGKKGTISIRIDGDIVESMAGKIQTLEEKAVITPDELADMHTVLETEKKYEKEKGDTKIYITTSYNLYDIYVSFKSTYVLNHSLANVIGLLKPEVYDSLFDENDNIVFQYNSPAYKLYTNVTFKEKGVFKNANGLYNVKLYK